MRKNLIRICTNIVEYTISNKDDPYFEKWVAIQNGMAAQIGQIEEEIMAEYEKREKIK